MRTAPVHDSEVFYSALLAAVERGQGAPRAGTAEQWCGWLDGAQRRGEFKQAERDWLGIDAWLEAQDALGGKTAMRDLVDGGYMLSPGERRRIAENPGLVSSRVTREQLVAYVRQHQVELQETTLGEKPDWDVVRRGPDDYDVVDGAGNVVEAGFLARKSAREFIEQQNVEAPRYARYQLPGGEKYRVLLLTLPDASPDWSVEERNGMFVIRRPDGTLHTHSGDGSVNEWSTRSGAENAISTYRKRGDSGGTQGFETSHFETPNILAHVRFNERVDSDGKKVLFIEEIQSDWHQQGRKRGYIGNDTAELNALKKEQQALAIRNVHSPLRGAELERLRELGPLVRGRGDVEPGVPNAPFKGTDEWAMLALKRMLRWASENGFEHIAWTTGAQQAERYDLSKQVHSIAYRRLSNGNYDIQTRALDGNGRAGDVFWKHPNATMEEIEQHVGKELAEKIAAGAGFKNCGTSYLEGLDLKVGGAGMAGFYDRILPATVNRWAKKFGASVGELQVDVAEKDADRFAVVLENGKVVQQTQSRKHADATAACFSGAVVKVIDHTERVHGLVVTPAMREAALEGLPLFKREMEAAHEMEETEDEDERPTFRF